MDGKTTGLSILLSLLLVGGIFTVFVQESPVDNDSNTDTELDEENTLPPTNTVPNLLMPEQFSVDWNGQNATINGFVVDESVTTSYVLLMIFEEVEMTQVGQTFNISIMADGSWQIDSGLSSPGNWIIQATASDEAGLTSAVSLSQLTINAPVEDDVAVTFLWQQPEENSTIGTLSGVAIHRFPATCTVEYHPLGQSPARLIDADENTTTGEFSLQVNTSYHNNEGDIVSSCGLFSTSTSTIRVNLPLPPEPEGDADQDGILDDADMCDSTPAGEPVYDNGCSDSETDDDQDAIMNDKDMCPNTPAGEAVDANGCSASQRDSDQDGVSDALDICPNTPTTETADSEGCSPSQKDGDNDGVSDAIDQCPNTPAGEIVGTDGCTIPDWDPEDSWLCQNGQGAWVKDFNGDGNSYSSNNNGVNSAGGGGSGPWFQCEVTVATVNGEMVVDANGIPNHDFLSTMGCCTSEVDLEWHIPLNPVNDTGGGHSTTNCPASAGRWECAPDRGPVAVSVNGAPIYGVEEGPGGDAIALNFKYFVEDRQPIVLGYCTSHSAGDNFHYHYDAQCSTWTPGVGETIADYDWTKLDNTQHSPIIGWAFDGFPIYGMYGNDGSGGIKAITSSYEVERSQENGDQGYNGIDDWNYAAGVGDLDECNGRWGPTPEYPEGIYHYVSTPLSGSTKLVTDTDGNQAPMIGMPYFLLCYHGVADVDAQPSGGQGPPGGGGGPPPGGAAIQTLYQHLPELLEQGADENNISGEQITAAIIEFSWLWLSLVAVIYAGYRHRK
jgi:hypothetical protein